MGDLFARRLLQIEFRKPDILVPVPLHSKKEAQRGYNQSQKIAEGLASKLGIPIRNDLIKRIHYNKSQTQRNRLERWKNSEGLFQLTHVSRMENVHLAIVDDVITTGSTIEAVANELLKLEGVKLSVYSLAFTH
jgi:ComF family protein